MHDAAAHLPRHATPAHGPDHGRRHGRTYLPGPGRGPGPARAWLERALAGRARLHGVAHRARPGLPAGDHRVLGRSRLRPQARPLHPPGVPRVLLPQRRPAQTDALRADQPAAGGPAPLPAVSDGTPRPGPGPDVVVCRGRATTLTEIAAVGAAAIYVP